LQGHAGRGSDTQTGFGRPISGIPQAAVPWQSGAQGSAANLPEDPHHGMLGEVSSSSDDDEQDGAPSPSTLSGRAAGPRSAQTANERYVMSPVVGEGAPIPWKPEPAALPPPPTGPPSPQPPPPAPTPGGNARPPAAAPPQREPTDVPPPPPTPPSAGAPPALASASAPHSSRTSNTATSGSSYVPSDAASLPPDSPAVRGVRPTLSAIKADVVSKSQLERWSPEREDSRKAVMAQLATEALQKRAGVTFHRPKPAAPPPTLLPEPSGPNSSWF